METKVQQKRKKIIGYLGLATLMIMVIGKQRLSDDVLICFMILLFPPLIWLSYLKYKDEKSAGEFRIKNYIPFIVGISATVLMAAYYIYIGLY